MPGRSTAEAAPPTPWARDLVGPNIDETAFIHSFSHIIGDVRIGANVIVAPGTSIRADEGSPFYIGENTNIQDGVVIHGLEQGRVVGDDGEKYSIWVGKNTCLTHMALIHGPCYVGDDCFIGFRSTVFNARVGNGCIVMMHALVQDVEIPPGKYVPSGAVITSQQQADRLPDVQAEDKEFAHHVVGINQALRAGYRCAADNKCIAPIRDELAKSYTSKDNGNGFSFAFERSDEVGRSLSPDTVDQLRYLFEQGLKIGTEHVDARRFRTGSWQSCQPIEARSLQDAIAALERCLADHSGEYVRLFGIETKGRKRVLETIIQRPDGGDVSSNGGGFKAPASSSYSASPTSSSYASSSSNGNGYSGTAGISGDTADQIRGLLSSGYRIGTEHVDERRFRTGTWQSCQPFESSSFNDVMAALADCMTQHQGEYVRLIGIDTKAKRRVLETIIQRPDGVAAPSNGNGASRPPATPAPAASSYSSSAATSGSLDSEAINHIRQLVAGGYKISAEHVDARRFRTGSWQSCGQIEARGDREAIATLEAYMGEYAGEYVRLIGIDPKAKRRVLELIVQRP